MKVLLVDDNPTALQLLVHALTSAGFETETAQDGIEALAKVNQVRPDIIVMDVMMPRMNGIQATIQLRAEPETAAIPIILLTARDRIEDKLTGFGSGADDYLVKPVLPAELIARIHALVRRAQRVAAPSLDRGHVIGVWGVKGGVGTSTVAVNVALALAQSDKRTVLADLHPWAGSAAAQLGLVPRASVELLAQKEPVEINHRMVEESLERHRSGLRVFGVPLNASRRLGELSAQLLLAVLDRLETMAEVIVLDLGSGLSPWVLDLMARCHSTAVVIEADAIALAMATASTRQLEEAGLVGSRLTWVVVNRVRSASTYTREEIERELGSTLAAVITPAPEVFFHATKTGVPVLIGQPDSLIATQLRELSAKLL